MHFYELIKNFNDKELIIFCDMDGVLASYDVGKPLDFLNKRPLMDNIKKIEIVGNLPNVELYILSICRMDYQINEKNNWLDKYAPFFKKENRIIISKENNIEKVSANIKANYLNNFKTNKQVILIDDDNGVLKKVMNEAKDVIVFQDSELVD